MQEKSLSFNLEPTFRCNLECPMCPRFSSEDPYLDMSMETFSRIHEGMVYAHTVDMTGWGEPLLSRQIYRMIRMSRDQQCAVTITSNGTALTETNGDRLIDSGLNRLAVSVDGVRPETYNRIRLGSDFEQLTAKLARFSELIDRRRSDLELGIAFTLQEGNASDLERLVPWLNSVGARVLHLKQLNVLSNAEDWRRSFLRYALNGGPERDSPLRDLEARLLKVAQSARASGIRVLTHSELPMTSRLEGRHCLATPLHSVYFSFEGMVSPCCHFGHHVSRFFQGRQYPASALFFGDIRKQTLEEIWNSPDYQVFRRGFVTHEFPEACRTCYLLYGK